MSFLHFYPHCRGFSTDGEVQRKQTHLFPETWRCGWSEWCGYGGWPPRPRQEPYRCLWMPVKHTCAIKLLEQLLNTHLRTDMPTKTRHITLSAESLKHKFRTLRPAQIQQILYFYSEYIHVHWNRTWTLSQVVFITGKLGDNWHQSFPVGLDNMALERKIDAVTDILYYFSHTSYIAFWH